MNLPLALALAVNVATALPPAGRAAAAEHPAASAQDIARLTPNLKPGDTVVLTDGIWTDQQITLDAAGTVEQPITFRAQTPGKVVLTGESRIEVAGKHLVVSGLYLKDFTVAREESANALIVSGSNCRVTQCAIVGGTAHNYVHVSGPENRVDHCYLADKANDGPTMQVEAPNGAPPHNTRIDHNHFGPRPPLRRNGGETLRVGYSHQQTNLSGTVCEFNLFDRCDGELEIISSKSCGNAYRANTFLECAGTLTLRHGDRCLVDGNFFLGGGKSETGGIRVLGDGHVIVNNYIDGVRTGAMWLTAGVINPEPKEHVRATNCLIAHNTVVDSTGTYIHRAAGYKTPRRVLKPEGVTMVGNVFALGPDAKLFGGLGGAGVHWSGNFSSPLPGPDEGEDEGEEPEHPGVTFADLKVSKADDGLWRPAPDSPVRGAGERLADDAPAALKLDMDGQARAADKSDAGADQVSTAPVTRRPLTPADVGPSWMDRTRK